MKTNDEINFADEKLSKFLADQYLDGKFRAMVNALAQHDNAQFAELQREFLAEALRAGCREEVEALVLDMKNFLRFAPMIEGAK